MTRSHRVLVYLDDFDDPDVWGYYCLDCPLEGFGSTSELYPSRVAKKHAKATKPALMEAS